jgi:hypothetical protein
MQSSIRQEIALEYTKPKTYNTTLSGGYFIRNYTYSNENNNVNVNQNFFLTAHYKERKPTTSATFSFNPEASLSLYTQSNANFNNDKDRVAEFTPSTLASIGYEIEHRETNIGLTPTLEHEYFSALEFDEQSYSVIKETQFWVGAKLTKYFFNDTYNPYIQASAFTGRLENSSKYSAHLGINYKNHYIFEVSYNETNLTLDQDTTINNATMTFGYRY